MGVHVDGVTLIGQPHRRRTTLSAVMAPSDQDEQSMAAGPRALPGAGGTTAPALSFVLAPTWASASIARERTESWLRTLHWPQGPAEDLVLAVSEAVSNSVEHGYLVPLHEVDAV